MRRFFLTLLCACFLFGLSFGQDISVKPKKGTKGLSFSVRGLSNLGVGGVGAGIGGKYWRSERLAYTASIGFSGRYTTADAGQPGYSDNKGFSGSISVTPGFEYHYFATDRISPYWGTGIAFSISRSTNNAALPPAPPPGTGTRIESWRYSLGPSFSFGIEWFVIKNLSIAGSYQVNFSYERNSQKWFRVPGPNVPEVTKATSNSWSLNWGTSALVATFYF
jgi:hypothetical protein